MIYKTRKVNGKAINNPMISPASAAQIIEAQWGQIILDVGVLQKKSEGLTVGK